MFMKTVLPAFGSTLLIADVKAPDWLQIVLELINQGDTGGNVELYDFFVRDVVEKLYQSSKTVPVRYDQDTFSCADRWREDPMPVREKTAEHILEAFRERNLTRLKRSIARVFGGVAFIILG
jgi:hypothetical protein